jgi:hypothetical protein
MTAKKLHFLHIGKNAGTQMGNVAQQINADGRFHITKHPHYMKLINIPENEDFFFSIRSPETRFYAGFYSRKRKGQPRGFAEWTPFESEAFTDFEHANDLAEALFEPGHVGLRAMCAIKSIFHCAEDQVNWFPQMGYFLRIRVPLMIVRKEHFESDVTFLFRLLGMTSKPLFDRSAIGSHANNYADVPALSPKAMSNLRRWYAQDFEFNEKLNHWLANQFPGQLEGLA